MADVEFEREKILLERERNALLRVGMAEDARAKAEVELSTLRGKKSFNWNLFIPLFVAIIGATASILGTAYSQFKQADLAAEQNSNTRDLQFLTAQQDLIKLAVTAEEERADANIRFLVDSGLVPNYQDGLEAAIEAGLSLSAPAPESIARSNLFGSGSYRQVPISRIVISDTWTYEIHESTAKNYNYVIDLDGSVVETIAEELRSSCAKRLNRGTLCIAVVGYCYPRDSEKYKPLADVQMRSLINLVKKKLDEHDLASGAVHTRLTLQKELGIAQIKKCSRINEEIVEFRKLVSQ